MLGTSCRLRAHWERLSKKWTTTYFNHWINFVSVFFFKFTWPSVISHMPDTTNITYFNYFQLIGKKSSARVRHVFHLSTASVNCAMHFDGNSRFSQTHKVGSVAIIDKFVLPYICFFLRYFYQLLLANETSEIRGYSRIAFHGSFHQTNWFLMAQLSSKVGNVGILVLWKTLLDYHNFQRG